MADNSSAIVYVINKIKAKNIEVLENQEMKFFLILDKQVYK